MRTLIMFLMLAFMSTACMDISDIIGGGKDKDPIDHPTDRVPDAVLDAFDIQFPDVEGEKWKYSNGYWYVTFEKDGMIYTVKYDKDGNVISMEMKEKGDDKPKDNQLPDAVKDKLDTEFGDYRIIHIGLAKDADVGMYYIIHLLVMNADGSMTKVVVFIAPDGTILKTEEHGKKDEDKDDIE